MSWRTALVIAAAAILVSCAQPETRAVAAKPSCRVLCGRVRDARSGKAIERFDVAVFATDRRKPGYALPRGFPTLPGPYLQTLHIVSPTGEFDLPSLAETSVAIGVNAPGHLLFSSGAIHLPSPNPMEIALERAWQVTGRVLDERGQAVAGASLYNDMPSEPVDVVLSNAISYRPRARSEADGRFTVDDVQTYTSDVGLLAVRDGFFPQRVLIPITGPTTTADIHLKHGVPLTGTVVDSSSHPAAGVWVEATPSEGNPLRVATGPDGRFRFDALPPERVRFAVSRQIIENPEQRRVELDVASRAEFDLRSVRDITLALPKSGVLHGTMTGLARQGFEFYVQLHCGEWSRTLQADMKDGFRTAVPAGECDVVGVTATSGPRFETERKHRTVVDGSDVAVDLPFPNPTEVHLLLNGRPLQALLTIMRPGSSSPVAQVNSPDGVYRFAGLPAGAYEGRFDVLEASYRIPLDIGSRAQFTFDLQVADPHLTINDEAGNPHGAKITMVRADYAPGAPMPIDTPRFGGYTPFGEYELRIELRGYEPQTITLRVPGQPRVVALTPKPYPFPHPAVAPPIAAEELAVLRAVVQHSIRTTREFWRGFHQSRGRLIVLSQTSRPIEEGTKENFPAELAEVRSLDALRDVREILLQPLERIPLWERAQWELTATEIETVDWDAFAGRYPKASGLLMLGRPLITRDEAVVSTAEIIGAGTEEFLIRLRRRDGKWAVVSSVVVRSVGE